MQEVLSQLPTRCGLEPANGWPSLCKVNTYITWIRDRKALNAY